MRPEIVIELAIKQVLEKLSLPAVDFSVEHPAEEGHGDFATNVAMALFRESPGESKNPRELAEGLVSQLRLDKGLGKVIDETRIEVAGPGFINFWLRKDWLLVELSRIASSGDDYGRSDWGKGKRILVDYSSPNIAKLFSVGHLRSTIIGQAIYNLYRFLGFRAVGDNHLGDWGTQFGMIIAAVEEKNLDISAMTVEEVEALYVEINNRSKDDPTIRERAKEAFVRLERGEEKARKLWKEAVEISMREFDRIYARLGVKIDYAFGESYYEKIMPEVIEMAKQRGIARQSEGAWIVEFPDLPPAMLVKSDGTTTYFTRDLATIKFRNENPDLKSDLYVYEVGAEQSLHFQQVFAAAAMLGWGKRENYIHVGHGLVLGKDGKKMSTRRGTTFKLEVWLNEIIAKAAEINDKTATEVGIGAVKFNDLKHSPGSNYIFSLEEALSLDGASGPYLQYTYARCRSVLAKAGRESVADILAGKIELNEEEMAVLRKIYQFPEVLLTSAKAMSPNLVCSYVIDLSQRFNTFYNKHTIIGAEKETAEFRLLLTGATAVVIRNALIILGITPLEKM